MTRTGDGLPPAPGDLAAVKRALRAEMVARRRGLDPAVRAAAHRAAAAHFLANLDPPAGTVVAAYWATAEEFDAGPLIEALLERGCIVALPVVERRNAPLLFRRWRSGEPLVPAGFGLKVPDPAAPVAVPELLAVPLLAFDAAGYRLGYGGGYYDRTLAALRAGRHGVVAAGLGYAAQALPQVPHDAHDQPLDWLVSETGARRAQQGEHE